MKITRRDVLLGATATAALPPLAARAQTSEVVIGVIYPFSGANAQMGVDAQKSFETALDIINKNHDFDLPLAKGAGLPGLGGAKVRLVFADHQADPQKGRAETERLITQEKVCAVVGTPLMSRSSNAISVSVNASFGEVTAEDVGSPPVAIQVPGNESQAIHPIQDFSIRTIAIESSICG